ncbi:MAG TPA: adenylyltransferase/cytidyltransferase family protein [Elusimicrobiota bacterium]|nr:adenylyltransferase/cytidyltransferase family protein [Elusimicrobiota bacterium]HNI58203.1 adenylyltransferase/cytidyltransferase family protein [Elusimicrobiota bacterium]
MATTNVLPPAALLRRLAARRRGRRVVFTNGCFDLFHAGHLKVLNLAKRAGDLLVVGLNDDRSVRRLKGPKRPILPLKDRAALMGALKDVDYVTWFGEDTPHDLIRRLKPEVLVKGGDWSADQIVGREFVKKVVRVPLLKGRSTSGIIATIARRYGRV